MSRHLQLVVGNHVERLWTAPDGTVCLLATSHEPPFYSISLVRDEEVVRERRVYGLASAQMIALGWRERPDEVLTRRANS